MGNKKVTLTIDGVDANEKKSSTKIQYVNPNIDDSVMLGFATLCAGLSTDTYTGTTKTTDEDITNTPMVKPDLEVTLADLELMRQRLRLGGRSENTNAHFLQFLVINPEQVYPVKVTFQKVNNTDKTEITKIDWMPVYMPALPAAGDLHGIWDLTAFEGATGNIEMTLTFAETLKTKETKYKVTVTANAPTLEKITE